MGRSTDGYGREAGSGFSARQSASDSDTEQPMERPAADVRGAQILSPPEFSTALRLSTKVKWQSPFRSI